MKNFIIGLFVGALGFAALVVGLATECEEAFDKLVESWRAI